MSHRWACLLGHPVAHSLSPRLHNAAFAALGIDATYEAWDVPHSAVGAAVTALRRTDCLGANVTAPHKLAAVAHMDEVVGEVDALGVLNTIVNRGGRLIGMNTDARGLARWMTHAHISADGADCLVLGAGGAARATVWALADLGATSVLVLNRTPATAEALVALLQPRLPSATRLAWGDLSSAATPPGEPWSIVVNATSLSHHGGAPPMHPDCYSPGSVAIDLAYNPPVTGFMAAARAAGARAENGLGMLLHQAALAFERWTGQAPPIDVYERALADGVDA